MIADVVLNERFDFSMCQSAGTEPVERELNQLAAQAFTAAFGREDNVWNMTNPGCVVFPSRNESDSLPVDLNDEDPVPVAFDVDIQMPPLPPLPIVTIDRPEFPFDCLIDRNAVEGFDQYRSQDRQVVIAILANLHILFTNFRCENRMKCYRVASERYLGTSRATRFSVEARP